MSYIDAVAAIVIMGLFFAGFSQAVIPAGNAWERAQREYRTGETIRFTAESFRMECAKADRDLKSWKKSLAIMKELESCETSEIIQRGELKAIKATCVISGIQIEIIGVCAPL